MNYWILKITEQKIYVESCIIAKKQNFISSRITESKENENEERVPTASMSLLLHIELYETKDYRRKSNSISLLSSIEVYEAQDYRTKSNSIFLLLSIESYETKEYKIKK